MVVSSRQGHTLTVAPRQLCERKMTRNQTKTRASIISGISGQNKGHSWLLAAMLLTRIKVLGPSLPSFCSPVSIISPYLWYSRVRKLTRQKLQWGLPGAENEGNGELLFRKVVL